MSDKTRAEFEEVFPRPSNCEWNEKENAYCWAGFSVTRYLYDDLWQAWLAAKEKYEPRWISCEDSLPEDGDCDVLAFWDHGGMDIAHAQAYAKWYLRAGVTHWMPLPSEPSTQGGEE